MFYNKIYINVYDKFEKTQNINYPKIKLNNICIELYFTDWCDMWDSYDNSEFMPEYN